MGAFEQLFSPGRGGFEQRFFKNSNARGVAQGGMLKLRFDWYITSPVSIDITATVLTSVLVQYDGAQTERL